MSTNHTEHCNLSLWEASDQVTRTEFNENHAKIDAALGTLTAGQLRIHVGQYTGNGTVSNVLEFPFAPKFVWIQQGDGQESRMHIFGGQSVRIAQFNNAPVCHRNGHGSTVKIEGNKVTITGLAGLTATEQATNSMNLANTPYLYLAIG